MKREALKLDQSKFLECHGFKPEEFQQAGIAWDVLEAICSHHTDSIPELRATADYIAGRLSQIPCVHSLKVRIKHPEHLIAKIIRKKIEKRDPQITVDNYRDHVTDLIGIRALHLFKDQWQPIHDFVMESWSLHEQPIAYVREGDPEAVVKLFQERGCDVQKHAIGYRSVHYLILSQPAKERHITELQVRTLFEEAWSEIDHQVRYPRLSSNPHLAEFLTIFNRLAGSADEMGTFIKALSGFLSEQAGKLAEMQSQLSVKETEMKKAISQLKISREEKQKLEAQVAELRDSSEQHGVSIFGGQLPSGFLGDVNSLTGVRFNSCDLSSGSWSQDVVLSGLGQRKCSKCGRTYTDNSLFVVTDKCPDCRGQYLL
jgi:putative GTP pyrophosphokinase